MNVVSTDMKITSDMKKDAENKARELILNHDEINQAEVCKLIKGYFDYKYQPNWHCVIGKNFYTTFSHEENKFIFIKIGDISLLLFKMG